MEGGDMFVEVVVIVVTICPIIIRTERIKSEIEMVLVVIKEKKKKIIMERREIVLLRLKIARSIRTAYISYDIYIFIVCSYVMCILSCIL